MSVAIYARFSTDKQKQTSIDDQIRRCRQLAAQLDLEVNPDLVYFDEAITGKAEGLKKRSQFQTLLEKIDSGDVRVVIVDEISRLTRNAQMGGQLMDFVDQRGTRFITHDGVDTGKPAWRTVWLAKLMMSAMESEHTSSRTTRGMLGQLERGYQIAQAPFGYRPTKETTEMGRVLGTTWSIHTAEATIVKSMYQMRADGQTISSIGAYLNTQGIAPPGAKRANGRPYWRLGTVVQLLRNPIYKGQFVWNGSNFSRTKARKRKQEPVTQTFERPTLRIVSDELWEAANRKTQSGSKWRSPRGGGRHLFSGLVRCGDCGAHLCVGSGNGQRSLFCAQCLQAFKLKARESWLGYTSVAAAQEALLHVLTVAFTGSVVKEFHRRLTDRLKHGPAKDLETLDIRLKEVCRRIDIIQGYLLDNTSDPLLWHPKYKAAVADREEILKARRQLERTTTVCKPEAVALQQSINPVEVLRAQLAAPTQMLKLRAALRRITHQFELVDRPSKGTSVFHIALQPGVVTAELTETSVIDDSVVTFEVTARTTHRRPVVWELSARTF